MTQNRYCFVGAAAPERLDYAIARRAAPSGYVTDARDVLAVALVLRGPSGFVRTLAPVVVSQTADLVVARHVFAADAADVPSPGAYAVFAFVTTPSGTVAAGHDTFTALAPSSAIGPRLVPVPAVVELGEPLPLTFAPPVAPTNSVLPVASGILSIGATLSATAGTWGGNPTPKFTQQWMRRDTFGRVTSIAGATSATYVVTTGDLGYDVFRRTTATNSAGVVTVDSNAIAWTPAQIDMGLYAHANLAQTDGALATLTDLSPRGRTLTTAGGVVGSRNFELNVNGVIGFDGGQSQYAKDVAGDALTAAQTLHQRGTSLYWAGELIGSSNAELMFVGTYDGASASGNNARGVSFNAVTRVLKFWLTSNLGGGTNHIGGLPSVTDIRSGDRVALWWELPAGSDAWVVTIHRMPRRHLGETAIVEVITGGSFSTVPNSGPAKCGWTLGANATPSAYCSSRVWAAGACTIGANHARDKADFFAAFDARCRVAPVAYAATAAIAASLHQDPANQLLRAQAAAVAEQAVVAALAARAGLTVSGYAAQFPAGKVPVGVLADSRGVGTGATVGTNDFRTVLHPLVTAYPRIGAGPYDDGFGQPSAKHFSVSGYAVRNNGGVFGHSQRSPHNGSIDKHVGLGQLFNRVPVWHVFFWVNGLSVAPVYWDWLDESARILTYVRDSLRDYGAGLAPGFVLHTETATANGTPQLEQTRALNTGLDALTTWARDTLGVDCALVNCDDWTYQP